MIELLPDLILETHGLTKEFRGFAAVQGVDLKVRRGTIHALIGPNGAGKTTVFTFNDRGRGLGLAHQVLRYALYWQGMLAMTGAPIRAFVRSREGLEAPDLMLGGSRC